MLLSNLCSDDILIKELTEHKLLYNLEDLKKTKWLISRYFNFGNISNCGGIVLKVYLDHKF